MIRIFATLRQRLLSENRFTHYLGYAAGEIVLVVIGILIALQINNWNDARKDRARELDYLHNIREDVRTNIAQMDTYLQTRNAEIAAAQRILLGCRHFINDQHLEVGARKLGLPFLVGLDLGGEIPLAFRRNAFVPVGLSGEHLVDAPCHEMGANQFQPLDHSL